MAEVGAFTFKKLFAGTYPDINIINAEIVVSECVGLFSALEAGIGKWKATFRE